MKAVIALFFVLLVALCIRPASAANTRVIIGPAHSPVATASPKPDRQGVIITQPSAAPTCGVKQSQFYGDPNGCLYGCADQRISTVTRPLNVTCVFPTTTATP